MNELAKKLLAIANEEFYYGTKGYSTTGKILNEAVLQLTSPNTNAEGSGVDHEDQPAVPVGSDSEDLESFENEGGHCGNEN